MKQVNLFKLLTLALGILNLVLLLVIFLPPHRSPEAFKFRLIRVLELDESQTQKFETSARKHRERIRQLDSTRRQLIQKYFQPLRSGGQKKGNEKILSQLKEVEAEKMIATYLHFEELKGLCNDRQLKKYPEILEKALQILLQRPGKIPPPPKDLPKKNV